MRWDACLCFWKMRSCPHLPFLNTHPNPKPTHQPKSIPQQVNSTFTIEPILTEGSPRMVEWKDKWTVVTADGGLAAQMEHTLLITPNGAEILTVP